MIKYIYLIAIVATVTSILSGADTVTLNPTDDARVKEFEPAGNFGDSNYVAVGYETANVRTLIKFDLSPYVGTAIDSAYLRFYVSSTIGGTFPIGPIEIGRNDVDWDESTVTWNNGPNFVGCVVVNSPDDLGWWEVNITDFVQEFVDGTYDNYGFQILKSDSEFEQFNMYSKEHTGTHPELVLVYTTAVESESLGGIKAAFK